MALRDPRTGDWSLVVVTGEARVIRATVTGGLKTGRVHVWRSTASSPFEQLPDLVPADGTFSAALEPDAVFTFTTTTGQRKGSHGPIPPRRPFPLPYADDFEQTSPGDTPRYLSDQKGTFEVARRPGGGNCVTQVVPEEGILWYGNKLLKPHTLFGDPGWTDYAVEAAVQVAGGDVEVGGRYGDRDKLGYRWVLARDGRWTLLDMEKDPGQRNDRRVLARRVAHLAARDERPHAPRAGRWQAADRARPGRTPQRHGLPGQHLRSQQLRQPQGRAARAVSGRGRLLSDPGHLVA